MAGGPDPFTAKAEEVKRLRRFLERIASTDEITGDGPLEPILYDPTGTGERELRARMEMAKRGLEGEEYP